ncbi:ABC transporter ATP-binding protein [Klebsiella pneumoniae]
MQPFINIDLGGPAQPLLKVNHLLKYFRGGKGREVVQAVDDISFTVMKGETLGVVGESGCGKSTTARLLMQLLTQDSGELIFDGQGVGSSRLPLKAYRRQVQMVFQDSYASLNPRLTMEESIAFGQRVHGVSAREASEYARYLLAHVGLEPARFADRYPHALSGGQRQRVNIARALAMKPRLVILDEAVSALDKSVEAQVLQLLQELKRTLELTYVFISHDLHVVRWLSDRILVMYLGEVVEIGPAEQLFTASAHPYTRALLSSMPSMDPVNGVSFEVQKGEVMALIGESGSGKSVTLRALMRLHPPGSSELSGTLQVGDDEVLTMSASQLRRYRGGRCAMIFQEPLLAFDPVYTVGQQIIEGLRRHEGLSRQAARDRALEALRQVRIPSPERRLDAYPHEMSGGMRQRAMIALALSCNPQLLLADEPTTALDATVQIQILILLREQQKQRGLSIVFVTHDIGAAVEIADRVAVMYAGRIVEEASMSEILRHPRHPYTQVLLGSRPKEGLKKGDALHCIPGAPPDLARLPPGCAFAERCPHRRPVCEQSLPPTESVAERHAVSCHRWRELAIDANAQALAV